MMTSEDLAEVRETARRRRALHHRSMVPAAGTSHHGRHYCVACSVSIDDMTAYIDWPCPTARLVDEARAPWVTGDAEVLDHLDAIAEPVRFGPAY
jgi:hypothetical protein